MGNNITSSPHTTVATSRGRLPVFKPDLIHKQDVAVSSNPLLLKLAASGAPQDCQLCHALIDYFGGRALVRTLSYNHACITSPVPDRHELAAPSTFSLHPNLSPLGRAVPIESVPPYLTALAHSNKPFFYALVIDLLCTVCAIGIGLTCKTGVDVSPCKGAFILAVVRIYGNLHCRIAVAWLLPSHLGPRWSRAMPPGRASRTTYV